MATVIVMMVFGGGIPNVLTITLIAAAALVLLVCLMRVDALTALRLQPLAFRIGLIGIAVLPLLQLVPLPPALWHRLPGQALRIQTLTLAGLADSWQPLSVTPLFTARAAVIAIAFFALVTLVLTLSALEVRRIAWLIFGIIGLNILIGLIQVASAGQTLQIYDASDHGALLGFYANKNHAALVLAASLPIAAYLFGSRQHVRGTRTWLGLYAGVVLVALVTTNSRAGLVLGVVTMVFLGSLYLRSVKPLTIVLALAAMSIGVFLISRTSAFDTVFGRFGYVQDDLRWQFLSNSRPIIAHYWLFGSGVGSFSTLYNVFEGLAWVQPVYVNQLHDEYPQLLLEAGLPGIFILAMLVAGIVWRGTGIWMMRVGANRLPVICGATILALIALHSIVDYPLRRPAVLPVLAIAIALLMRGDLVASTGIVHRKQRA